MQGDLIVRLAGKNVAIDFFRAGVVSVAFGKPRNTDFLRERRIGRGRLLGKPGPRTRASGGTATADQRTGREYYAR